MVVSLFLATIQRRGCLRYLPISAIPIQTGKSFLVVQKRAFLAQDREEAVHTDEEDDPWCRGSTSQDDKNWQTGSALSADTASSEEDTPPPAGSRNTTHRADASKSRGKGNTNNSTQNTSKGDKKWWTGNTASIERHIKKMWKEKRIQKDSMQNKSRGEEAPHVSQDSIKESGIPRKASWTPHKERRLSKYYTTKIKNARDWIGVNILLGELEAMGIAPNVYHFTSAIIACGRSRNWEYALELFDIMKQRSVQPNNFTYYTVISACKKGSQWEKALEVFREMESCGIEADVISYNLLIKACEKGSQWEKALELLREMESRGIEPSVITYNAAISAYDKGIQWEKAIELLREMEIRGLQPNIISYGSAINACQRGSQWEKAIELLREMESRGIESDAICYNSVISACANGLQWEKALDLLREMESRDLQPDATSYGSTLSACFTCGQFSQAYKIMRFAKDAVSLNSLIRDDGCWNLQGVDLATGAMCLVDELRIRETESLNDVVIVTREDDDDSVLKDGIPVFLREHMGIDTTPIPGNDASFSLKADTLREWRERATRQHPGVFGMLSKPPAEWSPDDLEMIDSLFL